MFNTYNFAILLDFFVYKCQKFRDIHDAFMQCSLLFGAHLLLFYFLEL